MSENHSNKQPPRAAVYVRMTTTGQEDSPERQRAQTVPYAGRKYRLVADPAAPGYPYQDLAMHGADQRPGFDRLLADARAGQLDVVVCDEWSRLSRTDDPLDFLADVARPLRRAGVVLDTVKEGLQDWDSLAGLIMATIYQSRASGEVKAISHRVLSNARTLVANGRPAGGGAPFGYKWEYEERVAGGRRKPVPVRLVPDGLRAEVVRTLFELYAAGGTSLDGLVAWLTERGVPPPRAGRRGKTRWERSTVRRLLRNDVYTGRYDYGRQTRARWSRVEGGVVVPSKDRKPAGRKRTPATDSPQDLWVVSPVPHEPLVSQEVYDRVQSRLRKNRDGRGAPARQDYLLSGLLVCAHCKRTLVGRPGPRGPQYRCPGEDRDGYRGPCNGARVYQRPLLDMVAEKLRRVFLQPAQLEELRADIRRCEEERRRPANLTRLRQEVRDLAGQVERARGNLALLEPDEIPAARRLIADLKARHDARAGELAQAEAGASRVEDLDQLARKVEGALFYFEEGIRQADPRRVRAALEDVLKVVTVGWTTAPSRTGVRRRHRLAGGHIYVQDWLAGFAAAETAWLAEYPGAADGSPPAAPGLHLAIPFAPAAPEPPAA